MDEHSERTWTLSIIKNNVVIMLVYLLCVDWNISELAILSGHSLTFQRTGEKQWDTRGLGKLNLL